MISFEQQGETCLLQGQLTQDEVTQLWPNRHQLFTASTQVLDLSALTYADSAGIAMLLAMKGFPSIEGVTDNEQQSAANVPMSRTLVNPSAQLTKMIELYDLDAFFAASAR
ncbi:STAS domain-containing protein [Shewanella aestuarii]|uniref:STAS domain-containing protein n=1 Tax=Shewanella aestuarii TaxID=1028752 RepID=A0A6G9QI13_9GAMM|nr:STAS domain-containing protein [Shewanella aestuarii]QIR13519.1 STAS domain-containing protein [Shewanella aestuarii]